MSSENTVEKKRKHCGEGVNSSGSTRNPLTKKRGERLDEGTEIQESNTGVFTSENPL